ncbi:MAG: DNA polymerase III subunit delta [Leptospirillia bacterium]
MGVSLGDPLLSLWVRRHLLDLLGIDPAEAGASVEPIGGDDAPQYRLLARIRERPLFGGKRILWVAKAERAEDLDPKVLLERNRNSSTVLVLEAPEKTLSAWSKVIAAYSLALPSKPADREAWLQFLAERHELRLTKEALPPLLTTFEGSPGPVDQLFASIKKAGDGPAITSEILQKYGVENHYKTVFELLRGLEGKDKRFFSEWRRFLDNGQSPFGLLSLLHRQWKLYRIAQGTLAQGGGEKEAARMVASVAGVQPFVADSAVRAARKLSANGVFQGLNALTEADRLLKSGVAPDLVMDRLSASLFILFSGNSGGKPGVRGRTP